MALQGFEHVPSAIERVEHQPVGCSICPIFADLPASLDERVLPPREDGFVLGVDWEISESALNVLSGRVLAFGAGRRA